jgi:hypothetical protein
MSGSSPPPGEDVEYFLSLSYDNLDGEPITDWKECTSAFAYLKEHDKDLQTWESNHAPHKLHVVSAYRHDREIHGSFIQTNGAVRMNGCGRRDGSPGCYTHLICKRAKRSKPTKSAGKSSKPSSTDPPSYEDAVKGL